MTVIIVANLTLTKETVVLLGEKSVHSVKAETIWNPSVTRGPVSGQLKQKNDPITDDPNDRWLAAVTQGTTGRATVLMQSNGKEVRFHIDSAANVNTISQECVMKDQEKPTQIRLGMWNDSKMIPIGKTILPMSNPRDGTVTNVEFVVVENSYSTLWGLKTISYNTESGKIHCKDRKNN